MRLLLSACCVLSCAGISDLIWAGDRTASFDSQLLETANFRIHHSNPDIALRAARVLEASRERTVKVWDPAACDAVWSPRCDVVLRSPGSQTSKHCDAISFAVVTCEASCVIGRMIVAPQNDPRLLESILPHEVTHVVVRSRLRSDDVPCWLDEGVALVSDSTHRRRDLRADIAGTAASSSPTCWTDFLQTRSYPAAGEHRLFYARSLVVCEYLLLLGDAEDLMQFTKMAISDGTYDRALRKVYSIHAREQLEERLTQFVTTQVHAAARREVPSQSDPASAFVGN